MADASSDERRVSFDGSMRESEDAIMRAAKVAAEAAEAARMAAEAAARLGGGRVAQEAAAQAAAARGYKDRAADIARESYSSAGGASSRAGLGDSRGDSFPQGAMSRTRPLGDRSNNLRDRPTRPDEDWESEGEYDEEGFYTQDDRDSKVYLDGYGRPNRYHQKREAHVPVAAIKPTEFSFDGTHPAYADAHFVRTVEQDQVISKLKGAQALHDEKQRKAAKRRARVAAATTPVGVVRSGGPRGVLKPRAGAAARREVPGFMPPGFALPREPALDRRRARGGGGGSQSARGRELDAMFGLSGPKSREAAALESELGMRQSWARSQEWARHEPPAYEWPAGGGYEAGAIGRAERLERELGRLVQERERAARGVTRESQEMGRLREEAAGLQRRAWDAMGPGTAARPAAGDPARASHEEIEQLEARLAALKSDIASRTDPREAAARAPPADPHPAAAPMVAEAPAAPDPTLAGEELARALGRFEEGKYRDFEEGMAAQMRRRAEEGKYDSDIEKERRAEEEEARRTGELRKREEEAKRAARKVAFDARMEALEEDNEWMDYYREGNPAYTGYKWDGFTAPAHPADDPKGKAPAGPAAGGAAPGGGAGEAAVAPQGVPGAWAGEASNVAPAAGGEGGGTAEGTGPAYAGEASQVSTSEGGYPPPPGPPPAAAAAEGGGDRALADHLADASHGNTMSDYEDPEFTGRGRGRSGVEQGEYYQYHSEGELDPRRGGGGAGLVEMGRARPGAGPTPGVRKGRPREWAHTGCALILGRGPHGDGLPRPAELRGRGTVPQPFTFEERQRRRPKPIMQVKLEQDLALREEARHIEENRGPFKAREIPRSTLEPRLERMLEANEYRRHVRHEEYVRWLARIDAPFSCYHRSTQAQANRAKARAQQRRRNPFYKPFKANDIPRSTLEPRYHLQSAGDERRRVERQQRARDMLAHAAMPPRMEAWAANTHEAQNRKGSRSARPHSAPRYATAPVTAKPLGYTPDFGQLHQEWHERLTRARERNSKRLTVPEEFQLNGGDPEVRRLRQAKADDRQARILLDIELDNQELPEMRWPWASTRAKARYKVSETKSSRLRVDEVRRNTEKGQYASRAEKEAGERERRRQEAARRAKAWLKTQTRMHGSDFATGDFGEDGTDPAGSTSGGGGGGSGSGDASLKALGAPKHYREARHKQKEEEAKAEVEQILLQNDVYEYVEG